jgi:hypothetical protein
VDAAVDEKPLSRVGSFLFAETLRAWVGQLEDGTVSLGAWPLIRAVSATVARSAMTPPTGLQSLIAVLD